MEREDYTLFSQSIMLKRYKTLSPLVDEMYLPALDLARTLGFNLSGSF